MTIPMKKVKNNGQETQPKFKRIDKYYWLNKGYEMVDGGLTRIQKQIASVNTYINSLLGVYVLGTIIDSIYYEIDVIWKLGIVLLPILVVKWATFYGKISVIPDAKSFYPDSAQSSEATYYQFLRDSQIHLEKLKKFAAWCTAILLSVLFFVTWLTVQSKQKSTDGKDELVKVKKELTTTKKSLDSIKKLDVYSLNIKFLKKEKKLLFEATLPKNDDVDLQVFNKNNDTLTQPIQLLVGPLGKLNYHVDLSPFPNEMDTILVKLKYHLSSNEDRLIQKTIVLKSK